MMFNDQRILNFSLMACLAAALSFFPADFAEPADEGLYPQWQREYADNLFSQKNYEEAIVYYAEVLAKAPLDASVFDNLSASVARAFQEGSETGKSCQDLLGYIEFLKTRVQFYTSSTQMIESQIRQLQEKYSQLKSAQKADFSADEQVSFELTAAGLPTVFTDSAAASTGEKFSAYEALQNLKKAYLSYIDVLNSQDIQFRKYKVSLDSKIHEMEKQKREVSADLDIVEIRGELAMKDAVIAQQEERFNKFSDRFESVLLEVDVLEKKLAETSGEVKRLTQELAGMSLSLYEGTSNLADRTAQIHAFEQELAETQERLLLVQKIVSDKDGQILNLEKQIDDLRANPQTPAAEGLVELREEVSHLRDRIQDVSLGNQVTMAKLSVQFEQLAKSNAWLRSDNLRKDVQVMRLRKSLQDRYLDLARVNDVFTAKDQKIGELNGRLNSYREKITELTLLLQQREIELKKTLQMIRSSDSLNGQPAATDKMGRTDRRAGNGKTRLSEFINEDFIAGLSDEAVYYHTKRDLSEFTSSD